MAIVAVMACMSFTACEKGIDINGPTPITTPTPAAQTHVIQVLDALTGGPVLAASVNGVFTDSTGKVTLTINVGDALDIVRSGYCDRKSRYREEPVDLLSTDTGCDYEADIIYHRKDSGSVSPMQRLSAGNYTVSVDESLAAHVDRVQYAVEKISEVTGGDITFSLVPSGGSYVITIDPSKAPAHGCSFSGNVVACSSVDDAYKEIIAHELGHAIGFGHTSVAGDLMSSGTGSVTPVNFSQRERVAWLKMAKRQNGNRWPDTDPSR